MKYIATLTLTISLLASVSAKRKIQITSPDGRIAFHVAFINKMPSYSVVFKGRLLVENSEISLSFNDMNNVNLIPFT